MRKSKIRRAKKTDLDQILVLGEEFYTQLPHAEVMPFNREHIQKVVEATIDKGIAQVAVEDDNVVGMLLMVMGPNILDPAFITATEYAFYVTPEARGRDYGKCLVKQGKHVAKQQGVKFFNMLHMGSEGSERAEALYVQDGFQKTETLFTKEL